MQIFKTGYGLRLSDRVEERLQEDAHLFGQTDIPGCPYTTILSLADSLNEFEDYQKRIGEARQRSLSAEAKNACHSGRVKKSFGRSRCFRKA